MTRYVLKERVTPGSILRQVVTTTAIVGGVTGVLIFLLERIVPGERMAVTVVQATLILLLVFTVGAECMPNKLVEIRPGGVEIRSTNVPWPSIWQVVVIRSETTAKRKGPEVALRLRRGAPLPEGVNSLVFDPSDPVRVHNQLRVRVPEELLDAEELVRTVRTFGVSDVQVIELRGSAERFLG